MVDPAVGPGEVAAPETWPSGVSVLVPAYQAAAALPGCLEAIWAQDWDGPLEVVVADGGSTDGTRDVVAAAAAAGRPVRLVDNPMRLQAAGLNAAALAARHDLLVRCDAQARLPACAVRLLVAEHRRVPRANVGGRQVAVPTGRPFADAVAAVYGTALGAGGAAYRTGARPADVETVYLGSWRREDLLAVGGFDPTWAVNEDTELNVRWLRAGGRVRLLPDVAVAYRPRSSPRALARQYARYGWWRAQTFRRHRDLRPRQAVALAPLGALVLAGVGRRWWTRLPLAAYGVAVGVGGARAAGAAGGGPAVRARAPLALVVQHLAWGTGFVAGLLAAPVVRHPPPPATLGAVRLPT